MFAALQRAHYPVGLRIGCTVRLHLCCAVADALPNAKLHLCRGGLVAPYEVPYCCGFVAPNGLAAPSGINVCCGGLAAQCGVTCCCGLPGPRGGWPSPSGLNVCCGRRPAQCEVACCGGLSGPR